MLGRVKIRATDGRQGREPPREKGRKGGGVVGEEVVSCPFFPSPPPPLPFPTFTRRGWGQNVYTHLFNPSSILTVHPSYPPTSQSFLRISRRDGEGRTSGQTPSPFDELPLLGRDRRQKTDSLFVFVFSFQTSLEINIDRRNPPSATPRFFLPSCPRFSTI